MPELYRHSQSSPILQPLQHKQHTSSIAPTFRVSLFRKTPAGNFSGAMSSSRRGATRDGPCELGVAATTCDQYGEFLPR